MNRFRSQQIFWSSQLLLCVWVHPYTDVTAGIVRSDDLTQDDEVDDGKPTDEAAQMTVPDSAAKAAWAAFVQLLYGTAEFQFVR
jgi:hypothetical protein